MKYTFDHDYHIHSVLSTCSKDELQSPERMLQYAKENGLRKIVITDHYWDSSVPGASDWYVPQNYEWIKKSLPLPKADGVEFLFGAETEMRHDFTIGISERALSELDFIIVPTTHLNNAGFGVSEELATSPEGRAKTWLMKLEALLSKPLPFHKMGVAHLACGLIAKKREDYLSTLELLPEAELKRLFKRAADVGIGVEINADDMKFKEQEARTVLRPFEIAKSCGCKFYLGSDSHHPENLDAAKNIFLRAIDYLELKESDKFYIGK